jgi:glucokinase
MKREGLVLAADVGGTKTLLGLFRPGARGPVLERESSVQSRDYRSLATMIGEFLGQGPKADIRAACLAVAGPVEGNKARLTNLPWSIDGARLAAAIGTPRLRLLNDVQAAALGMLLADRAAFVTLNPAAPPFKGKGAKANIALIAPGTGLGEAMLYWDGQRHHAIAAEAGHADFAPRNDEETALRRYLQGRYGKVSVERVLSGPGLAAIHDFVRASRGAALDAQAIADAALAKSDAHCVRALEIYAGALASEAGNLALRTLARGGIIIGGGIAPKILPALKTAAFRRAYADKDRMGRLLRALPVVVALEKRAALFGAAREALGL